MMQKRIGRSAARRRSSLLAVLGLLALAVGLTVASAAQAQPSGEYANFAQCPLKTAEACVYAKTESGEFTVGKKTVPIEKDIVLQGGFRETPEETLEFLGAENGETLTPVAQNVPGGLTGLVNCKEFKGSGYWETLAREVCEWVFENEYTGVRAITELAGPASSIGLNEGNLLGGEGTALALPLKVRLENPLLGSECYVGSNSAPIDVDLTTGTTSPPSPNKPISGKVGTLSFNKDGTILTITGNSLVNNSFAAPAATGCGGDLSFLLDPIIDSELGVPSAAGHNTAILSGMLQQAGAEAVAGS